MCSKHVEAWKKLIVKQKFFASSWLITETNTWQRCSGALRQYSLSKDLCVFGRPNWFGDICWILPSACVYACYCYLDIKHQVKRNPELNVLPYVSYANLCNFHSTYSTRNTVSKYILHYFQCYTVHVVELLNYHTNHCTYIKFIKFTH